eukprot:m.616882 g.616882  ORF g.616882 m.616882 type:complete len:65 (-) comp22516_c0_seq1:1587-1781(-)
MSRQHNTPQLHTLDSTRSTPHITTPTMQHITPVAVTKCPKPVIKEKYLTGELCLSGIHATRTGA